MADERDQGSTASEPKAPTGMELPASEDEGGGGEKSRAAAAPRGLELNPKPEPAVRLKKSIGIFVALGGFVLAMVIALSIAKHKGVQPGGAEKQRPTGSALAQGEQVGAKLQEQADEKNGKSPQAALAAAGGAGSGDVGDNLNLPPVLVVPRGQQAAMNGVGQYRGGPQGPRTLTPLEQAEEDEYKAQQAALVAPMAVRAQGGGGGFGGAPAGPAPRDPSLDALGAVLGRSQNGTGAGAPQPGGDDQNKQEEKQTFLDKAKAHPESVYLNATRVGALSPYEIKAGWDIPATLEQAVNTDLPGEVRGLVRENVYDTATGHYLLIPQGSRVIGTYNHRIAYGQTGVQVIWTRLIYPDGSSISLGGMVGEDARGQSGFRDRVDNHYKRLIGFALLTSAFSAGIELSQNQNQYNTTGIPTNSEVVTQALGQQLGELGITITEKNLNIQPTIKISVGYRFNVRVDRDIAFPGPYVPYRGL